MKKTITTKKVKLGHMNTNSSNEASIVSEISSLISDSESDRVLDESIYDSKQSNILQNME